MLDKKLAELGGTRATPLAAADEATGLEETVEPWTNAVIQKLIEACNGSKYAATARVANAETKSNSPLAENASIKSSPVSPSSLAIATASSPKTFPTEPTAVEEKKMDHDEINVNEAASPPSQPMPSPSSAGVATIRNLLSLSPNDQLPPIQNSSLPSMVSNLSSCELIDEEQTERRSRGNSLADNMTLSSGSSGFLFTLQNPYESTILNARYLTNTVVDCAKKVSEIQLSDDNGEKYSKLAQAMEMYEDHFPLAPSSAQAAISADEQRQYEKNGKRVIEMTLSLPDDFTLEYEPGDSVGLIVPNTPQSTNFILSMLQKRHGILPTQKISVDANHPITVEDAIRNTVDLCSPMKKKRLYLLSMYATDPEEEQALRLLCGSSCENEAGVDLYQRYVEEQRRTVVDILQEFPSCQNITLEGLFGCLPSIPPRYYSVCSSPLKDRQVEDGNFFHLKVAFSVVDYLTPSTPEDSNSPRRIGGLATRYLECLCSPFLSKQTSSSSCFKPSIKIFPKPTHEFRLPPNMSTPLILIGPGTGIAPFLGFLSHRQAQIASLESTEAAEMASEGTWRGGYELDPEDLKISNRDTRGLNLAVDYMREQSVGDIDLFFGCRYSDHDWLYKKEVDEFKSLGIISNLYTAFSRENANEKTYVQTIMQNNKECGQRIVEMIMEKHASVYVCGDGNAMGKDVQEAIVNLLAYDICEKTDGVNLEEAKQKAVAHVDRMKTFGRFLLDIWSYWIVRISDRLLTVCFGGRHADAVYLLIRIPKYHKNNSLVHARM